MQFSQYVHQFMKDTDKYQTHLSFNKGKYNVPDDSYDDFYQNYHAAMIKKEELYLIEKVYCSDFAFFLDLDHPTKQTLSLTDANVIEILTQTKNIINQMFISPDSEYIVSKRGGKYHVNFPNIIVESKTAKKICSELVKVLPEKLTTAIDQSVYNTGLRLLGSMKKVVKKGDVAGVYQIYDLETGKLYPIETTTLEQFMKTVVRRKSDVPLTLVTEKFKVVTSTKKQVPVQGIQDADIVEEIGAFLEELKLTNECLKSFDMTVDRIYAKQNKMGMFCYFVTIGEKKCPLKQREHQRASNPIYVEIGMNGVFVKCHDEECLRRRFPDEGVKLPDNYETTYAKMYLSMSTKYWKSEVTISNPLRRHLEESLTGSHYQVAKTTFQIYKERFRVDDVKNTTWYEFDGVRWNKSHLMNILLSEEVPKYYKGIKISDTSVATEGGLKDFLVNNDKIDANLRNQMVDAVISKLENVNYKSNVLNQVTYMFKTHDPEFCSSLDSNPYLVGFKNGVYDFKQNTFRASTPQDNLTFSTGYDYIEYDEENQNIKDIYEFLSKIITKQHVREYLLKTLGKSLVGIPDEKFFIWTGISGANGKSTLVNFLESTLGDYATSVDVSLLTNRRGNSSNASPDVIRLRGKRMFTFQEPEHDDKLRTGILKQYTGGDTIIARELFKAPVSFKLQGTMIMCCNDLPSVASIDGGTFRRIRVIEFNSRFCDNPVKSNEFKIDPSIKYRLQQWRPYFMSILIHWYNKYLYEGLDEPTEVLKATHKYKADNDKFDEFFDSCIVESDTFETNKHIYGHFRNWWTVAYPSAKTPELRELRRAMKTRYGHEQEKMIDRTRHYGFNVRIDYGIKSPDNESE